MTPYNPYMSQVTVRIPEALRPFAGGAAELTAPPGSVAAIIRHLGERYPQLPPRLLTAEGELRPNVNIFIGRENLRALNGLASAAVEGDVVSVLPAVAGG
jgi:molybdopterin converting factor small subunit